MADNPKPSDFLQRMTDRDFPTVAGVDVATVPKDKKPDELLFGDGANRPPAGGGGGGEEEEDGGFFVWTEEAEVVERMKKKGMKPGVNPDTNAEGFWYHDVVAGGRTQRYYGATRTQVSKALSQAQANATIAINDFKKKQTNNPPPSDNRQQVPSNYDDKPWDTKLPYEPVQFAPARSLSDAEVTAILELNQTNPMEAERRMFTAMMGCTPQQLQAVLIRMDTMYATQVANSAALEFQANHVDDWDPTPANQRAMSAYLNSRNLPVTLVNLEKAFTDLMALGKLTRPKTDEELHTPPASVTTSQVTEVEEVAPPPPHESVQHRPAPGTGTERTTQQTDREAVANLTSMPLADMRDTIQSAMKQHRARNAR